MTILQLSPFVLPQVRMGGVRLSPANMVVRPERISYVEGLYAHVQALLAQVASGGATREQVERLLDEAFLARGFVSIDWDHADGPRAELWEHARHWVSFDADALGILFADGRLRDERDMVFVPTGDSTAPITSLLHAIARGGTRAELLACAAASEIDIDEDFLTMLTERGVLDELPAPRLPASRFSDTGGDRVTWLGQNGLVLQSGSTTVWFDPLVLPRLRYAPGELDAVYPTTEARFLAHDDPEIAQPTLLDLPPPDAVVLSHEDADVCDLGLLACLPSTTPIIVPRSCGRPWEVDLADALPAILGDRPIVRLGHGERYTVGDIEIVGCSWIGEWPIALPVNWNNYVAHGREASIVLSHASALLPQHVDELASAIGDRGADTIVFAWQLYPGSVKYMHGFRESPEKLLHPSRLWPWFVPLERLFEPNPEWGVGTETLRALQQRCGVHRYHSYGFAGAPWLRFQLPHVHRANAPGRSCAYFEREQALAKEIAYDVPTLHVGVPLAVPVR